jgi:dTDP-4-amino-4,6-dideoxygalactose transaminase
MIGEDEKQAVLAVLESGNLAQGEMVHRFETAFAEAIGARHAVAVSSGTAALHLALLARGIGPDDEVITTPFSFIATANAILFTGAVPVFVDIEPDTMNLDPNKVEAAITAKTRAILPVDLFGHPADLAALRDIAARRGLWIIEDACQAHLAECDGETVGATGTACFSFYPTKNITTGEGGIVTTDDEQLADRLRLLRSHGQRERYHHDVLGYNLRMTDIHAAIGLAQLPKLAEFTEQRRRNAAYLSAHLRGVVTPAVRPNCRHVFHQYTIRVRKDRDGMASRLREAGIGTAVHYPVPIHRQRVYRELGYDPSLPEAEQASAEVLSLPVHPGLSGQDLALIVREVNRLSQHEIERNAVLGS